MAISYGDEIEPLHDLSMYSLTFYDPLSRVLKLGNPGDDSIESDMPIYVILLGVLLDVGAYS